MPAPVQASAPEASKAAPAAAPAAVESAAPAPSAAADEAAPAKPKRTRRASKPVADGEEAAKPKRRATRATRAKHTVADSSAPISDEVAQARALAQISEAQVVRARRRAAEREAAALTELAAPVVSEASAATETPVAGQPTEKPAPRTRRRAAKSLLDAEQAAQESGEAPARSAVGEDAQPSESATPAEANEVPVVDPALRPHRRGRKPKAFVEAEKAAAAAAAAAAAQDAAMTAAPAPVADAPAQGAAATEAGAPVEGEPADVRPGRSRRTAAKRSSKAKGSKKDVSEDAANEVAEATSDVVPEIESADQPATEKPKRTRKKSAKAKAAEHQVDADAGSAIDGKSDSEASNNADGAAPAETDESARPNRRQHKRNDERNERKDDRNNDRRNRQRDRKQRNKERNAAPTEPTLSREELAAMKVAELREKAKEFEIETTGKKKAELVEEIYTTAAKAEGFRDIKGILQIRPDSSGIIHAHGYMKSNDDAFVPAYLIRSARLRTGDVIEGSLRPSRGDKRAGLAKITTVNGMDPEQIRNRPKFGDLTPVYPNEPLRMEHGKDSITGRAIDIVSPIGKGQRGLIVSPPKAGKTTILKKICQSISINNPEVHLICLLVDERPEEVTDMQRSIKGEVVASTFDMPADNHTRVAELVIERAKRIVELGGDVVVVLDSITRLARAYNLAAPASGRILSGGVDSAALYPPKRFLGAARNIENGGSLTILASALIDTGSKMDEVIFEEFKGTGNMELKLDRDLADRRIFPAIDPVASGTRNEDLLVDEQMRPFVFGLRRILAGMNNTERAAASFIKGLKGTNTNQEFLVRSAKKHSDYEQTF